MENEPLTIENYQKILEEKDREIAELRGQINWLMEQLKLSKHRKFGSQSEQTNPDQMSMFNEAEATADESVPELELSEVKSHFRKKAKTQRDRFPEDLPVEVVEHELPEDERNCPECGDQLHVMGRETRDELKIIPAKAVIVRHVQHVYSCRNCEKNAEEVPIVKADMPKPVIKGSFASPEAIAHIATQKFVMGTPLYRQEQEWERNGILLSRQTMSNWVIKVAENWLRPIYNRMHELLCAGDVAHADETSLQVLHEPGKTPQSKSYMWLYRTSGDTKHPIVLYEYQPSRRAEHPEAFLKNFKGFLHVDGYEGYHDLPGVTAVGCWVHVKRKWVDALKVVPKEKQPTSQAARGIAFCDKLFHFEKHWASLTPEERREKRALEAKPVIDEFYTWIGSLNALPKTLLGEAAYYAVSQRKYLENYLLDGRLEISNNRAERSIKPFVIGRKNWLFANTTDGAEASAIFYSLMETAKENGLNPYDYLTRVFRLAPNLPDGTGVEALLPWAVSGHV